MSRLEHSITRRQFASGSTAALGAMAASSMSSGPAVSQETDNYEPLEVAAGEKRFGYRSIIDSPAVKLDMPIGVVHGAGDGPTLIVTGGLYATEFAGIEAASRMYRDFEPETLKGRLIIVPVVNLSSFQFRTP